MPKIPIYQPSAGIPGAPGSPAMARPGDVTYPKTPYYGDVLSGAMVETGAALGKAGQVISVFNEQRRKAQQLIEVLEKESSFLTELTEVKRNLTADVTQYEASMNQAPKAIQELQEKHLKDVQDPEVKQALQRAFLRPSIATQSDVYDWGNKQRVDRGVAATDNSVATLTRLYHSAQKDDDKAAILSRIKGSIEASAAAGFINRDKAGDLWRKTYQDIMETEVMGMGRVNPTQTRAMLENPAKFPGLLPETRERIISSLDRKIEAELRRGETAEARALRLQERAIKDSDKAQKKVFDDNFDQAAALQVQGKLSLNDIYKLKDNRKIDSDGYRKLMEGYGKDHEKLLNEGEAQLDQSFRTTGPLEPFDQTNEFYRGNLKRELRDRVRKGESPNQVVDEIIGREMTKPKGLGAYPRPMFLEGQKDNFDKSSEINEFLGRLNKAQEKTSENFQSGKIDRDTALREAKRIKDLRDAANHEFELKRESENKKK